MRVVVVAYQGYTGAGILHAHELANQMVDLGNDVLFLLNGDSQTRHLLADSPRYELLEIAFEAGLLSEDLAGAIRNFSPDVAHLWTPRHAPARVGLEIFQSTSAELCIHYEDDEEFLLEHVETGRLSTDDLELYRLLGDPVPSPVRLAQLVPTVDRELLSRSVECPSTWFWIHPIFTPLVEKLVAGATCISASYLAYVAARTGGPVRLLYPGVDAARFRPRPRPFDLVRELGLEDRTVLLYSGTIAHFHDFLPILGALPEVVRVHPEVVLVQVGENFIEGETERALVELSLRDHVVFAGRVSHHEMPDYLSLADAFLGCVRDCPFNEHRLPSKVPEYMAMGRPILISRVGIGIELVDELEVVKVSGDSRAELARGMLRLLSQRGRWDDMGRRLRVKALELFDWRRSAHGLLLFYEELLSRSARRAATTLEPVLPRLDLLVPPPHRRSW